ncbi:hypothetical protein SO694_00168050 [Aureococcus anophagefferens]|uniref:Uncharacterized protein n=1 Tax=Aureococcus anophagefferens TaxID=44056 RepID=A0ABR1G6C4_AURAN
MRFLVVVAAARAATEDCTRAVFELRLDAAVARQAQEDVLAGWTMVPRDADDAVAGDDALVLARSANWRTATSEVCAPDGDFELVVQPSSAAGAATLLDGRGRRRGGAPTSSPTSTPSAPPSAAPSRAPLPAPTTRAPTAAPSARAAAATDDASKRGRAPWSTLTLEKQGSCDGPSCAILNTFDYATELPPHCAVEAGALGDARGRPRRAAAAALNATHQGFSGRPSADGPATPRTWGRARSTAAARASSFEGGACVLDFVAAPSLAPTINVSASSSSDDDDCDEAFLGLCWVPWGALVVAVAGVVFLVCVAGAFAACAGGGAAPKTIETKPTFTPSDAPPPGRPLVPPETTYPPDDGGAEEEKASPVRPLVYEPEEESIVPLDEPLAPPTPVTPFVFEDVEPRERALVPPSPGAGQQKGDSTSLQRPARCRRVDALTYTPVQDFAYRVRGSPRTPAYSAYGLAPAAGHLAPLPASTPISEVRREAEQLDRPGRAADDAAQDVLRAAARDFGRRARRAARPGARPGARAVGSCVAGASLAAGALGACAATPATVTRFEGEYADQLHPLCERRITVEALDTKPRRYANIDKYKLREWAFDGEIKGDEISAGDGVHEGRWNQPKKDSPNPARARDGRPFAEAEGRRCARCEEEHDRRDGAAARDAQAVGRLPLRRPGAASPRAGAAAAGAGDGRGVAGAGDGGAVGATDGASVGAREGASQAMST